MNIGSRNSQHSFAQIPSVEMARSQFDRSFTVKDTMDFDYLNPIFVDEILPGDTCNVQMAAFGRLATQIVPIMDNLYIDYFFFFVPSRLLWTNWEKFNGAQTNPGDSTSFTIPTITTTAVTGELVGTIYDKYGIPTQVPGLAINALPFRAYNLIWNEWFRDQNIQNSLTVPTGNGPDTPGTYVLQKRGKRHDYFTSMLPWPQKGTAVTLPLGTTAPVTSTNQTPFFSSGTASNVGMYAQQTGTPRFYPFSTLGDASAVWFGSQTGLQADLSAATAATINSLRQAIQIQSLLELDARGGTRYVEILAAHFNVISPDFRLQRPEYLGGGSSRINAHPVAQQSATSGSNYLGQLAAYSTTGGDRVAGFTKSFVEHGYVIGLAAARADITYQQGLNRMFTRSTRYDYFWPKLQQLGEQSVLGKELRARGTADAAYDASVIGYQERYSEYRYKPSEIHGQFRSTFATNIDEWHMAEEFASNPTLNATFIQSTTPIVRALASSTAPHLLFDAYFSYTHARPMMTYSVPVSLGRF